MMIMEGKDNPADDLKKAPRRGSQTKDSKKQEKISRSSLLFYGALAVVVMLAVAWVASRMYRTSYNVSVAMSTNTVVAYPYQTSYFTVNITNRGTSRISDLNVGFYLNGTAIHYNTVDLPAGARVSVPENYTYLTSGNYIFSAVADPARVLNIEDRNGTQSSVAVEINQPESPDIYTSLPNSNITYTQSFTLTAQGIVAAAATTGKYNISIFTNMFSPAQSVLTKLFENLYVFIEGVNGAYVKYAGNTTAYSVWIQGTVQPALIDYVLSSFHLNQLNTSINGTRVSYAVVNNQTSICYMYSKGWTRLLAYFNDSKEGSCLGIVGKTYAPEESNAIVTQIKANKNMTSYQEGFFYTNSTAIGSALIYNNSLAMVGFSENKYGFFTSFIQNTTAFKGAKPVCTGLIYTNNATSICSAYVASTGSSVSFGMVNTTELTPSYRLSLYSLVNQSELIAAHQNGASLINALRVSNSIKWQSAFKSTCALSNASIGCNVTSFDYTNNTARLSISNRLASALRINTLSCFAPGLRQNETISTKIASNRAANVSVTCISIPVGGIASEYTNYALAMNYTYMNITRSLAGFLNVTNQGLS
jgi:hypothetical protein